MADLRPGAVPGLGAGRPDPQPPAGAGHHPHAAPLAVVSVAVLEGAYAGAGFGLAVGLLWELSHPGGFGGLVFGMALAGMATGAVSQYALSQSFLSCLLCSAGVLGVLDGLRILRILFLQAETLDVLLQIAVPEVVLSLCWTPVVYWIFRRIYRRVGGTKLA